jgi:two-component system, chemotaxis family, protein-glutamate methylesterase/glutaminase
LESSVGGRCDWLGVSGYGCDVMAKIQTMERPKSQRALRVLVVDDTVVYRRMLQRVVEDIPGAEVVGTATNGRVAIERLATLDTDLVLLDVEMPEMDGLEALSSIRRNWPEVGVVLLSGGDRRSADMTLTALEAGAVDFISKADTGDMEQNHRLLVQQLGDIVRGFAGRRDAKRAAESLSMRALSPPSPVRPGSFVVPVGGIANLLPRPMTSAVGPLVSADGRASGTDLVARATGELVAAAAPGVPRVCTRVQLLAIGCSTGGPQALAEVIPSLPADIGIPVVVVQHMPPVFTASLAESLNRRSRLTVIEGRDGQVLCANTVTIAPGGRHMQIRFTNTRNELAVCLNDEPPVNSCRPSVDVLFRSVACTCSGNALVVVLTGMGEDGLDGVRRLKGRGATVLTENEKTCVVYGMPRAIDMAGLSDESVALADVASRIVKLIRQRENNREVG